MHKRKPKPPRVNETLVSSHVYSRDDAYGRVEPNINGDSAIRQTLNQRITDALDKQFGKR